MEYAKAGPEDILIRLSAVNRGSGHCGAALLPNLWLKNTWSWGRHGDHDWPKSLITQAGQGFTLNHPYLGPMFLKAERAPEQFLFTENETNFKKLFKSENLSPYVKDAFHDYVIHGRKEVVHPNQGTKAAFYYRLQHSQPAGRKF